MKEFIQKVGDKIRWMYKFEASRSKRLKFQEHIIDFLGVKDIGKLKDMHEGQYFLDNNWKKVCALDAVNDYLGLPEIDFKILDFNNFKPTINYNGEVYNILCSDFGEFPNLIAEENVNSYIVVYQKNPSEYLIHGFLKREEILKHSLFVETGIGTRILKGIDKIRMINEI